MEIKQDQWAKARSQEEEWAIAPEPTIPDFLEEVPEEGISVAAWAAGTLDADADLTGLADHIRITQTVA